MKRIIFLIVLCCICLVGCAEEISRQPLDARYTEPYSKVETDYEYKYSLLHGEFKYVPNVHTVNYPAKYEVEYIIKYDDGSQRRMWKDVDYNTYCIEKMKLRGMKNE